MVDKNEALITELYTEKKVFNGMGKGYTCPCSF